MNLENGLDNNPANINIKGPGIFSKFMCIVALSGCIVQIISLFMYKWRVNSEISYNYVYKGQRRRFLVAPTEYGLDYIRYDGGSSIISWDQRVERSKTKGYNTIQFNSPTNESMNIFTDTCPSYCMDAIAARISGYESIHSFNNILKTVLIISSFIALLGAIWPIFFKGGSLIGYLWVVAALASGGTSIWWYTATESVWNVIISHQQIPKPLLGIGYFLNVLGTALYVVAGVGYIISLGLRNWIYHMRLRKILKMQYSELQENDNLINGACEYSFQQKGNNQIMAPEMNVWNNTQKNNAVPFTQPNQIWHNPQSSINNFFPPGL